MHVRHLVRMVIALWFALLPSVALAADLRSGDAVVIPANQTINDDLYLFGGTISVQGTVNGDVVAFGGNITVEGPVTGDVIAAGGTVVVSGPVGGSVRAAGGTVAINGAVEQDVLAGTGNLTMGGSARIGRDLLSGAGAANVTAPVGRNVLAGAGTLVIASTVGGNVRAEVEALQLAPTAVIAGDLVYTSANQADVAQGAVVRGTVQHNVPARVEGEPAAARGFADVVLDWLKALVGAFVLGMVLILVLPAFTRGVVVALHRAPWMSLGLGVVLLVGLPILALVLFIAGLFVGGWWLGLIAAALWGIALAIGYVLSGLSLGRWILARLGRPEVHALLALLLGLVILTLVSAVPYVGWLVGLLAVLFGLGAVAATLIRAGQSPAAAVAP